MKCPLGMPYFQIAMSLLIRVFRSIYTRHCDDPCFIAAWSGSLRQNHSLNFPSTSRVCFVHWNQLRPFPSSINNTWWVLNLGSYTIPPCIYMVYLPTFNCLIFMVYMCREMYHMKTWILYGEKRLNLQLDHPPTLMDEGRVFFAHFCSTAKVGVPFNFWAPVQPDFFLHSLIHNFIDFFSFLRMETNKRGGKHQKNSHPRMAPRKGPGGEI